MIATNDKYNIFHNYVLNVINKHVPLKTMSKKESIGALKPWLSKGILRSIKLKINYFPIIKHQDTY